MLYGLATVLLGQGGAGGAGGAAPPGGGLMTFWFLIPFVLIFWFLILRPQKKERERRRQMIENIRKNDHVVTIGGIHGIVKKVEDAEAVIAIDEDGRDKVRIRVAKSAINMVKGTGSGDEESLPSPLEAPGR